MRSKTRYLFAIVVALATIFTFLCTISQNSYPNHEKAVLAALINRTNGPVPFIECREKLRLLGSNALPALIEMLTAKDSTITRVMMKINRAGIRTSGFVTAAAKRQHALRGFRLLGPFAAPAVPVLTNMIERGEAAGVAMEALGAIGDDGARRALERLLGHKDAKIRQGALRAIVKCGPDETFMARICLSSLDDPDPGVRMTALDYFPLMASTPSNVVARISQCLSDTNASVRHYATNLQSLIAQYERMSSRRNE